MPLFGEDEDFLGPFLAMNQPLAPISRGEIPTQIQSQPKFDIQKDYSPKIEASVASPQAATEVSLETPKPNPYDFIRKKYGLDERQKIIDQNNEEASGLNWSAALAALGAGLQGRDSVAAGQAALDSQSKNRKDRLTEFDKSRDTAVAEIETNDKMARAERERDPNSQETMLARTLAKRMLPSFDSSKMTAAEINERMPSLTKVYDIEQRKMDRQEQRNWLESNLKDKREEREDARQAKQDEKDALLATPYGKANTPDDAKQLKEAHESKKNFDSKIDEMISLREKHKGGAIWNRDDVARGKQLSKDLLLEYKNMAKLGVLSQADENIINAIIPEDPLQYNSPVAAVQGQDPTLNRLKKFRGDSDKDFSTRVQTRTRSGVSSPVGSSTSETKEINGRKYTKVPGGWKAI